MMTLYYRTTSAQKTVQHKTGNARYIVQDIDDAVLVQQDWKYTRHCSRQKIQYKTGNTRDIVQDRMYSTRLKIPETLFKTEYSTRLEIPETLFPDWKYPRHC